MDYVKERSKRGEALDIGEASLITVRRGIISYFRLLDPQSARSRMISYFRKLIAFFDGLIEERLCLRVSQKESKVFNDMLGTMLELMLEDNSQVTHHHVLHLLLVSIFSFVLKLTYPKNCILESYFGKLIAFFYGLMEERLLDFIY